ncbi:class I SAM-dependent methyltransferase [Nocardiopsis metallicus]|uniref:Ubiquinone/menaquinone biosynthesis C-methylase UbiE n=1 Tax=Nocardiopsis metallicus TaxID=179819 RepID=A0A840WMY6_9ACTN|nr:class I SAM-dependent methyltransferase [Nocardiopsis metallicus]MBB5491488.1 ubiquinone/menaquinone biosynthesis C-methylase UbiE [Nocardiopsis metallicus]
MPETAPPRPNEANRSIYNRLVMQAIYTLWVHWISHRLAWGISNRWIRRAYRTWPGAAHLTIGPGNGRFLRFLPPRVQVLHLMDLNASCLTMAARVVGGRTLTPHAHLQDVLARWKDLDEASLDSIDCMMVMHCLRGTSIADKAAFFAEARRVLKEGGVFFGATVLSGGSGVRVNRFARLLLNLYNGRKNVFANTGDTSDDLVRELRTHFPDADINVQGCTGTWVAVKR